MARRVPSPSVAPRARKLPVRPSGQQGGPRAQIHILEEGAAVVPGQEQHPLLRNVGQGGPERRASLSGHRQERSGPAKLRGRPVQRIPRSNQADQHAEALEQW